MPEEAIESIDIDPSGTAGAAFLGTARLQKLEKSSQDALEAFANILELKNERIVKLMGTVQELRARTLSLEEQLENKNAALDRALGRLDDR